MKIGCCLAYYKNHNNYGTSLQGYATVKVLQSLGHEVRIIKYKKNDSLIHKASIAPLQMMSGGWAAFLRRSKKKRLANDSSEYSMNIRVRTEANNLFKDEAMEPLCDLYVGYNKLQKGSLNYDAVLVGSDQVWTPLGLYSNFFNLMFVADKTRRISYASSFGVSVIPSWQRATTRRYLNRIDFLSVREIKAKEIVDSLSDKTAKVVCDPTLLRTRKEWESEITHCAPKTSGDYIFSYLLGGNIETRAAITKFAKEKNMKVVVMRHVDEYLECDETFGDECPYDVNPLDFLQLIRNARYVFTDSFHCSVFSILFNKQFVTFYRFDSSSKNSRNSRIDSLFSLFGLSGRLYNGNLHEQADSEINYHNVNMKVERLRQDSLDFLKQALK